MTTKLLCREYKYIQMELDEEKPKTQVFDVMAKNGDITLGQIKWYPHWRQYTFFPSMDTIFSRGCMEDINDFLRFIQKEKKVKFDEDGNGICSPTSRGNGN
jgi:hypothetical protein